MQRPGQHRVVPAVTSVLLHDCSVHIVQVGPANQAECQKRIGIEALRQSLFRELPELNTRFQRDFDDGSEHRLRAADNIRGSKEPHSVHKTDQAALIIAQNNLVVCVSVQHQIRRAYHEVGVNRLPLRDLTRDALKAILAALGVDGGDKRGATPYKGPISAETGPRRAGSMYMSPPKCSCAKTPHCHSIWPRSHRGDCHAAATALPARSFSSA